MRGTSADSARPSTGRRSRAWWLGALAATLLVAWIPGTICAQETPHASSVGGGSAIAPTSTADHTRFEILQGELATGPDVTTACLTCHTEAAKHVMATSHWTWLCPETKAAAETGDRVIGKGEHVVNNFCIALGSNEPRCTSCHAGYGWEDRTFDFTVESNVDCLVCHDTTGEYRKFPTAAGHPNYTRQEWPKGSGEYWEPPDLSRIARNVGKSSRQTCGSCHFWGGGGEGVKHGDMDATLSNPDRSLDVHMSSDGADFSCSECHTAQAHKIAGRCFSIPPPAENVFVMRGLDGNLLACESCHTATPHADKTLDHHVARVACQTCHVPTYARERPTKVWWDWSQAGKLDDNGKPIVKKDEVKGREVVVYDSKKGQFIWAMDEVPEYRWFNGSVSYTFLGDLLDDTTPASDRALPGTFGRQARLHRLDPSAPLISINQPQGSFDDPGSRIWPVKIHRGRQPYDPVNKTLIAPKVFGPKGSGAFWADFDWPRAAEEGMSYLELPYSGQHDFIQTEMYWPITHMVAPKEQAIACVECHQPDGRLSALTGFYLPGRDRWPLVDLAGWTLLVGVTLGTATHGSLRFFLPLWRRRRSRPGGKAKGGKR